MSMNYLDATFEHFFFLSPFFFASQMNFYYFTIFIGVWCVFQYASRANQNIEASAAETLV